MGDMQALEWAITYPDAVWSSIPLATTGTLSPQSIAFDWVGRRAIMSDPNWNGGNYYGQKGPENGLSVARMWGRRRSSGFATRM